MTPDIASKLIDEKFQEIIELLPDTTLTEATNPLFLMLIREMKKQVAFAQA